MRALDEAAIVAWASACVHSLEVLRPAINGINVYPVADSDTGSNLLHTMTGARDALAGGELTGAGQALGLLAKGAVRSARGNSGVILSQVLRGLAESASTPELTGTDLVKALAHADRVATESVARPVAGTMLTVLHAAATAATGESLRDVVTAAAKAASAALEQTPQQLPVLASAGVVDAGARGLVAVLDALAGVVTGTSTEPVHSCEAGTQVATTVPPYAWEVMYLLEDVTERDLPRFRRVLSELGDSVTVAGDGSGSYAVHVHCADIGAAIEAGLDLGRPHRIRVEPLITPTPLEPPAGPDRTVVALVRGDDIADLLHEEGVAVLAVPQGTKPSVEEMLGLVTDRAVAHITILAGDPQLTEAADDTAGHVMIGDREVVVIPCASPVQVLAALAVHDPARRVNDDVVAMAEAAAATRRGELVVAGEESITWVGLAHAGDLIGFVDGEVVLVESLSDENLVAAAMTVLHRMLAVGGELVTVLTGAAAPEGLGGELADRLREERPEVEFVSYPGGQTEAVLLIGVE
ncbi:DAK2 domain-containing protein [Amycolatopsis sp. GM8]|uniref:DAK2 domain-containing protein n=1 Tax=Amycolatopsis sp. GM8 TaxID=2896530 RepID=UPI001F01E3F4|nr:DAK2 domain-containing protein [Amycolatopsis sp. GM8]